MVVALMVGGPLHGEMRDMPEPPPGEIRAARPMSMPTFGLGPVPASEPLPEPYRYELRRYRGWASWPPLGPPTNQIAYLCMEKPDLYRAPADDEQAYYLRRVADDLWLKAEHDALPQCVVPGCPEKGRMTFTAAEDGRLAGRDWQRGDEIRVCPKHGSDIYRAQGARGFDQLAEWLRPDATWDWIDAYDIMTDSLYGAEILERTARMLRLAVQGRPR